MSNRLSGDAAALGQASFGPTWLVLAVAFLCLGASPVPAAVPDPPFPAFDIQQSCASVGDKVSCIRIENQAKTGLAAKWPGLSRSRKAQCKRAGEQQGGSYVAALGCADNG